MISEAGFDQDRAVTLSQGGRFLYKASWKSEGQNGIPRSRGAASRGEEMRETGKRRAQSQPLIAVRDVRASSRWYRQLLRVGGLPEHEHRDTYERILCDGHLILQLHAWDEEDHPNLVNADLAPPGHGVLLWFEVDDFDAAVERARSLHAEVIEEPHVNPNAAHREMWIRDPDGYVVVIAGS
jgi:catechol 2,3-dioxygenase-like lactoylglutathione lyase family enzyme